MTPTTTVTIPQYQIGQRVRVLSERPELGNGTRITGATGTVSEHGLWSREENRLAVRVALDEGTFQAGLEGVRDYCLHPGVWFELHQVAPEFEDDDNTVVAG